MKGWGKESVTARDLGKEFGGFITFIAALRLVAPSAAVADVLLPPTSSSSLPPS